MKTNFTAARVQTLPCDPGKTQTIHWDTSTPGLGLRVTANGSKAYVFEGFLFGKSFRMTIGDARAWDLAKARTEAARLRILVDEGKDPRAEKAEQRAAHEAKEIETRRQDVTLADAWAVYLADRRPKWSELHYRDHVTVASLGGEKKQRGKGLTEPGPLAPLLSLRLADLTGERIAGWLAGEAEKRPARARLAFNLLRIFAGWCESKADYRGMVDPQALSTRIAKDELPARGVKTDVLQREQLAAWFKAVRQIENPVMETYLVGLLLTGARREELGGLRWDDVDFKWRSLHVADKVEDSGRTIPLTPYFANLLHELKRINNTPPNVRQLRRFAAKGETWEPSEWVFFSKKSADGKLASPNNALHRVCEIAGIPPVTLHGLRRSFSSLSEWTETPTGVVAQIMGHKPSATAERHYKVRPLDMLRLHHEKLEGWLLEQAGIAFDAKQAEQKKGGLQAVR